MFLAGLLWCGGWGLAVRGGWYVVIINGGTGGNSKVEGAVIRGDRGLSSRRIIALVGRNRCRLFSVVIRHCVPLVIDVTIDLLPGRCISSTIRRTAVTLCSSIGSCSLRGSSFCAFTSLYVGHSMVAFTHGDNTRGRVPSSLVSSVSRASVDSHRAPRGVMVSERSCSDLARDVGLRLSGVRFRVLRLFLANVPCSSVTGTLSVARGSISGTLIEVHEGLGGWQLYHCGVCTLMIWGEEALWSGITI